MKTQTTNLIGRRAITVLLCDLFVVKTCRSSVRNWLLATLVAGGAFSLHAQSNAPDASVTAHTNAAATSEASTNSEVIHPVAAVEPAPTTEPVSKPAPSSGKLDYSSFKSVADRNIFNGNRSGQRMTATRSSTQQRSVRVESFSLVGTLLSEDKDPVAFFDGTSSELRKSLKEGGSIAGFTVKEILHAGVRLAQGTNTLDVFVGTGMRREDEGLWKTSTASTSYASSSGSSSYISSSSSSSRTGSDNNNGRSSGRSGRNNGGGESSASSRPATGGASSADVNEVLKRLMEKRDKE